MNCVLFYKWLQELYVLYSYFQPPNFTMKIYDLKGVDKGGISQLKSSTSNVAFYSAIILQCTLKINNRKKYFGIHFFAECQRYRTPASLLAGVLSQTFVIQPFKRRRHVRSDLHNSPRFLEWLLKDSWIQVRSHSLMNNKNQIHWEW